MHKSSSDNKALCLLQIAKTESKVECIILDMGHELGGVETISVSPHLPVGQKAEIHRCPCLLCVLGKSVSFLDSFKNGIFR